MGSSCRTGVNRAGAADHQTAKEMVILPLLYLDICQQMKLTASRSGFVLIEDPFNALLPSIIHGFLHCCCMSEAQDMLALIQGSL